MEKINLKGLDEVVYQEVLENGLTVYLWVKPHVSSFKGTLLVHCGAEDVSFSIQKKKYTVSHGTAHYLEHVLCKLKDNVPLLGKFNELGSYSNAATYPNHTIYEFVGTRQLKENIDLLLNSVQNKVFYEDLFELERGPILEEARMYLDNNSRKALNGIRNCLFATYPNRTPGIGNIEDITAMKLESLKLLYQAFYHPKNMTLVLTGNFDPLEVVQMVRDNQKEKVFPKWIEPKREVYKEPKKIVCKYREDYGNVESPKVYLSVKVPRKEIPIKDDVFLFFILRLVLITNFSMTSQFIENLLSKKMIFSAGAWATKERDYCVLQVSITTKYPEDVIPIFRDRLDHLELNEKELKRKIKAQIANLVLHYEDVEEVNDTICGMCMEYGKVIDNEKELLENLSLSQIKKVFSNLSLKEKIIYVLKPQKEKDD